MSRVPLAKPPTHAHQRWLSPANALPERILAWHNFRRCQEVMVAMVARQHKALLQLLQ